MEARVQKCEVYIWHCKYLCNQWLGVRIRRERAIVMQSTKKVTNVTFLQQVINIVLDTILCLQYQPQPPHSSVSLICIKKY